MGELQKRLAGAMEAKGIGQSELARRIGIKQQSVQALLTGDSHRTKYILDIAAALKLNPEWLQNGSGPREIARRNGQKSDDLVWISELDVRAAAGAGGFSLEVSQEDEADYIVGQHAFPTNTFRAIYGHAPEQVRICEIIGDSMQPTLFSGQRVMVNIADRSPSPPGIFFLWDGLGLVCKRLEYLPNSDPPTVRIMSDNQRYESREMPLGEAHIQGRVVGVWQRT